jgi:hypothetical protein
VARHLQPDAATQFPSTAAGTSPSSPLQHQLISTPHTAASLRLMRQARLATMSSMAQMPQHLAAGAAPSSPTLRFSSVPASPVRSDTGFVGDASGLAKSAAGSFSHLIPSVSAGAGAGAGVGGTLTAADNSTHTSEHSLLVSGRRPLGGAGTTCSPQQQRQRQQHWQRPGLCGGSAAVAALDPSTAAERAASPPVSAAASASMAGTGVSALAPSTKPPGTGFQQPGSPDFATTSPTVWKLHTNLRHGAELRGESPSALDGNTAAGRGGHHTPQDRCSNASLPALLAQHDVVVWLGDLNYRINGTSALVDHLMTKGLFEV